MPGPFVSDWQAGGDVPTLLKKRDDISAANAAAAAKSNEYAPEPDLPVPPKKDPMRGDGLSYKPTSVNGIYSVKGPDGSTTFTDVPGGHFEQSGMGGTPSGARDGNGRPLGTAGQGNFSAAEATAGGGLRYMRPDGSGATDEGTRQGFRPGTPEWARANANVGRGEGESDQDFGRRVAASKNAGLNFRSHSGEFALPAAPTDPSVIGPEAAYRPGAAPAGGGGAYGGVPNLEQAKGLSQLATEAQSREVTAHNVGTADQKIIDTKAEALHNSAKEDYLKRSPNDIAGAESHARVAAARDLVDQGRDPYETDQGRLGMQELAKHLHEYTNPGFGEDKSKRAKPGVDDIADYAYERRPWYKPGGDYAVTRGLNKKGEPDYENGSTTSGIVRTPSKTLADIIGDKGSNADQLRPYIEAARRHRANIQRVLEQQDRLKQR